MQIFWCFVLCHALTAPGISVIQMLRVLLFVLSAVCILLSGPYFLQPYYSVTGGQILFVQIIYFLKSGMRFVCLTLES
jgi:hypothetical protein